MYPVREYARLFQSLINDIKQKKKVAFLFGSAVSYSADGTGVPNVSGVIQIIKDYLVEKDMLGGQNISEVNTEGYQEWFDYLLSVGDQSDVQAVVERAVRKAYNYEDSTWSIPDSLAYFAKLVGDKRLNLDCVLTTNFDPLIQEALQANGLNPVNYYCESDSHIDNSSPYGDSGVKVLHLHGFWEGDTMHTPSQLGANRKAVLSSIKSVLNGSKLYVIGYGGWNDVVRQAIKEIIIEPKGKYEVRWCFFCNDEKNLRASNVHLFSDFEQAESTSRMQFYKGVDCHTIFRELYEEVTKTNANDLIAEQNPSKKFTELMTLEQILKPQKPYTPAEPKPYTIVRDEPHHTVRLLEQIQAAEALEVDGCVHLESPLGSGRLGFLSSLKDTLTDRGSSYFVIRVDLSHVVTIEQFQEQVVKDVGCDILALLIGEPKERFLLLLDNLDFTVDEIKNHSNTIVDLVKEFKDRLAVIFMSMNQVSLDCKTVKLGELLLYDVREYVKCDNPRVELTPSNVDRISELTSSLPLKLDIVRKHLALMSLPELLEDSSSISSFSKIDESIPSALFNKLTELSKSEGVDNVRLFNLIRVMSVLHCGQTVLRVKKFFREYCFQVDDFHRLRDLGFIYAIEKSELPVKFVRINPLVRDFILSVTSPENMLELSVKALSLSAGESWMRSQVKVCHNERLMMKYQDFAPGNIHTLIISVMKLALDSGDINFYEQAINAAVSFCIYLKRESQFKELANFARQALGLIENQKKLAYYRISYFLSEGLRMLGQYNESIGVTMELEKHFPNEDFYQTTLHQDMLSTLALALHKADRSETRSYAEKLKGISAKTTHSGLIADEILIDLLYEGVERAKRLKALEKKARNHNETTVANNISLSLVSLIPKDGQMYLDRVLNSEKNIYTQIRAVLAKVEMEQDSNSLNFLRSPLYKRCIEAYSYLFLQRLDSLFNRCHSILWRAGTSQGQFEELFNLYRTSSLVWRLGGYVEHERRYALILSEMPVIDGAQNREVKAYIQGRLKYIGQNFPDERKKINNLSN